MKIFNIFFLAILASTLLITSCGKENLNQSGVDPLDPINPVTLEVNPIVTRSGGGNEAGLDFDCFIINYPFGFVKEDGSVITIADEAALTAAFQDDVLIVVDFDYPLSITNSEGEIVSVADGVELADQFAGCVPQGGWNDDSFPAYQISDDNSCYVLKYPLDLESFDGTTTTVADEAEFNAAIAEEPYFFVWPLSLLDEDGEEVAVANVEEMFDALFSCNEWDYNFNDTLSIWNWQTGFEYVGCYMVEFPMDVVVDGETVTVEDHMQLCDLMLTGNFEGYAFPLTLIDEEGNELTVTTEDELNEALSECFGIDFFGPDLLLLYLGASTDEPPFTACYDIVFPISVDSPISGEVTYNNFDEVSESITSGQELCCLNYPISVVLRSDTSTVVLEAEYDLLQLLEDCE